MLLNLKTVLIKKYMKNICNICTYLNKYCRFWLLYILRPKPDRVTLLCFYYEQIGANCL